MSFQIVKPRNEVEIHLPDGRMLSGPRGAAVREFLASVEWESQLVGAIVNGELRELTHPIKIESKVEPVEMNSADGARIYRRSLTFLLEKAFTDLYPDGILYVDHSVASGGYYCQVSGREALSETEIEALKTHMQK
jgi:uridine kinase